STEKSIPARWLFGHGCCVGRHRTRRWKLRWQPQGQPRPQGWRPAAPVDCQRRLLFDLGLNELGQERQGPIVLFSLRRPWRYVSTPRVGALGFLMKPV